MSEDKVTEFKVEGQPAFPVNEENDNSADSSSVKEEKETNTDQTQSQEGEANSGGNKDDSAEDDRFFNHPRWKERESDWTKRFNEQEERHTSEIQKVREDLEKRFTPKSESTEQIPSWFGGDEEQWKEFKVWNDQQVIVKAKEMAVKDISAKTEAEQKAINDATSYFNQQVEAIENDKDFNPGGEKVEKNKLLKFVLDNELVDTKGRWNYRAGWKMMKSEATNPKTAIINEKKKVADATTSENRAEPKKPAFTTSEDFKHPGARPW